MKILISIFFVASSVALIGLLDSSLSQKTPKKFEAQEAVKEHPLLSSKPKRPPFNDEGPGGNIGPKPGKRSA